MSLLLSCPTCNIMVEVTALNCGVFRCGIYKDNGQQVNPHMSQEEYYKLFKIIQDEKGEENIISTIYGCGLPMMYHNGKLIKCGWI